ncbi:MAG: penicillin-binding protein [Patescibacteria group bacterium]
MSLEIFKKFGGKTKRKYTPYRPPKPQANTKYKGSKTLLYLTYLASFSLFSILVGVLGVVILLAVFSRDLPTPDRLLNRDAELSTKLYDRNGTSIFEVYGEKNRELVSLEDVSPYVVQATLATEDAEFYQHQGFSLRGMLRATRNIVLGEGLQGGSTLTQQVVKNTLLSQEQTISRKVKELILALQLENKYSKDEILQMYLNETPYGGQNYGILTAAKSYFNKHPSELTLAEAAYLAGLPQSPSRYSPYSSDPNAGLERKNYVLFLMTDNGWVEEGGQWHYLNKDEYEAAKQVDLSFDTALTSFKAPHFVFFVRDELVEIYGEEMVEQGGLQVTTTLDLDVQDMAQNIVKEEVDAAKNLNVGNGSLVALDAKTGQVLAMVGSKDYFAESEPEGCISGITGDNSCTFEPQLNVALANRQPGSSIKPITYATMLSQGYTAAYPFLDVPTTFEKADAGKPYTPENYDGTFKGPTSLRKSLGNSLNIPAVKALEIVGIQSMIDTAKAMGITTFSDPTRYGLSLTLGGGETKLLEMTGAYSTLAAKGVYRKPTGILEVKNSRGDILYSWRDNGGQQVIGEDVAFLMSDILSDDGARSAAFGSGSLLNIPGHQVAVKTGTTDDKRDNYFMAYTPSVVAGVWVGNNNNDKMNPFVASGITGATPIGNRFMREYLADKENEKFEPPENVKKIEVDELTGALPYGEFSRRQEWFIEGTEPTAPSEWYQSVEVCEKDGKLANDSCRNADKSEVNTYIKITAELPEWQDDVDAWVGENYNGNDLYFPPTSKSALKYEDGKLKEDVNPEVHIVGLKDGDYVPLKFRLKVEVSSPNDIDEVRFYIDGEKIADDSSEPYGYNLTFPESQAGEHEFNVVAEDEDGRKGDVRIKLRVSK